MKISKKTQYGLRAMVYLAKPSLKNRLCSLKEISEIEEIPFNFLEKIFAELKKGGLVKAKKGVQGGYFLARSPKKITAGEIIKILEGTIAPVFCVSNNKRHICPRRRKCKTVNVWIKIHNTLKATLSSITLADLARK
jgi:Rrf2 family protein